MKTWEKYGPRIVKNATGVWQAYGKVEMKWIAEVWRGSKYIKRRTFKSSEAAIHFANDWHDNHSGYDDVQIITPSGRIHMTNRNGNEQLRDLE